MPQRAHVAALIAFAVASFFGTHRARAQASRKITLSQSVDHALSRHPSLAVSAMHEAVADARVGVAKSEGLPKANLVGQLNYATGNAVPGLLFAMPGIPNVSGPPTAARYDGVFQSAVGASGWWDVTE